MISHKEILTKQVKQLARFLGAGLVGIAPADRLSDIPGYKPEELLPGAKSIIVMAKMRYYS